MRSLVISALTFLSLSAWAAAPKAYQITMTYSKDEKKVFSARTVTPPGKQAVISQEEGGKWYFLAVTADEKDTADSSKGILVKITAGTLDKDHKQIPTANFGVLALENKKAEVKQAMDGPEKRTESVVLTVVRKN